MAPKQWHFPNFRATLMIGKGLAENGLAPGLGSRHGAVSVRLGTALMPCSCVFKRPGALLASDRLGSVCVIAKRVGGITRSANNKANRTCLSDFLTAKSSQSKMNW